MIGYNRFDESRLRPTVGASSFLNTEPTTARFDSFAPQPKDASAEELGAVENALLDVIAPRRNRSGSEFHEDAARQARPILVKKIVGDSSMVTGIGTVKSHAVRRKEIDRQVANFERAQDLTWGIEHLGGSGPLSPSGLPSKHAPPPQRRLLGESRLEPQEAFLETSFPEGRWADHHRWGRTHDDGE